MNISVILDNVSVAFPHRARATSLKQKLTGKRLPEPAWHPALDQVSFRADGGDRIGIVGRNGAGKTTLLKVVAGIYPPLSGSRSATGRIAPVIAQGLGFDSALPLRANIRLALLHADRLGDWSPELEQEIIQFAELDDYVDQPLVALSSGMRGRLAFSISMFQAPDILLLDEVFATGDAGFVRKAEELALKRITSTPLLFFVSHNNDYVRKICNRCILLERGAVAADGPTEQVLREYDHILSSPQGL